MTAAHTPISRATAATCGNRKASSAMVRRPMRRVDAKQKEIAVVTTRATVIENISDAPDVGCELGRV